MTYNRLNNLLGWAVFALAMVVYALTAAPTASFWDCGEFIAVSYELEVPHPPGAPLYLMVGRLFTLLASDPTQVALMMNLLSGLFSAFAVLFAFWITTLLAKKILAPGTDVPSPNHQFQIFGAGVVAALSMAWSDTFWFSAVEAEVYAPSSMFICLVFWLLLKWEARADEPDNLKWIVLAAYVVGLSIGVHLMALVILPGLGLIYYFRRYGRITWAGGIATFVISLGILGLIQVGVIQKTWNIAQFLELKLVGTLDPDTGAKAGLGMPKGAGFLLFAVLLVGGLVYGIYYAQKKQRPILSTALLSVAMVYLGFTSYTMIFLRSNANPPIDENNPENIISMLQYLKREQYGDRPLLYGPQYNSQPTDSKVKGVKYINNPAHERYLKDVDQYEYLYGPLPDGQKQEHFFPRMYDTDPSKYNTSLSPYGYAYMVKNQGQDSNNPKDDIITGGDNLRYYLKYQLGYMFFRYFLWNFVGRASDIQWGPYGGQWEDGLVRSMPAELPEMYAESASRNHYYFLPLLLGLLGVVFHFQRRRHDATFLLVMWVMAGIGIATFLNMGPQEPRERDYAFVGAMQLFCIWVGLGVLGLADLLKKNLKERAGAVAASIGLLASPILMISQNYDDHDRSGQYTPPDSAYNLLNSCKKDAILFTNGDNDTFPLWYIQEVEGVRTDVRVVNLSLANTDWYIQQMKQPMNGALPVPISYEDAYILGDRHQIAPVAARTVAVPVDKAAVKALGIFDPEEENLIADTFRFEISPNPRYGGIFRKDDMVLNIIENVAKDGWKRPVYFASTMSPREYDQFANQMQQEGMAYRVVPRKPKTEGTTVALRTMYRNLVEVYKYRNLDNPQVYYDDNTLNMIQNLRRNFASLTEGLANAADRLEDENTRLIQAGQPQDSLARNAARIQEYRSMALKALDYANKVMPDNVIPTEPSTLLYYGQLYQRLGEAQKGAQHLSLMRERALQEVRYLAGYYAADGVLFDGQNFRDNFFFAQPVYTLMEAAFLYDQRLRKPKEADTLMLGLKEALKEQPGMLEFVDQYAQVRLGRRPGQARDTAQAPAALPSPAQP